MVNPNAPKGQKRLDAYNQIFKKPDEIHAKVKSNYLGNRAITSLADHAKKGITYDKATGDWHKLDGTTINLSKKSSLTPFWMRRISHTIKSLSTTYTKKQEAKFQKIEDAYNKGVNDADAAAATALPKPKGLFDSQSKSDDAPSDSTSHDSSSSSSEEHIDFLANSSEDDSIHEEPIGTQILSLKDNISSYEAELSDLQNRLTECQKALDAIPTDTDLNDLVNERNNINNQMTFLTAQAEALKVEVDNLNLQTEPIQNRLRPLTAEIDKKETEVESLMTSITDLTKKIEEKNQKITTCTNFIETQTRKLENLEASLALFEKLQKKIDAYEKILLLIGGDVEEFTDTRPLNQDAARRLGPLFQDIGKHHLDAVDESRVPAKKQVYFEGLVKELADTRAESQKAKMLQMALPQIKDSITSKSQEKNTYEEEITWNEADIKNLQGQITSLQDEITAVKDSRREIHKNEFAPLNDQATLKDKQHIDLRKEIISLQIELSQKDTAIQEARHNLQANTVLKAPIEAEIATANTRIREAQSILSELKEELSTKEGSQT